MRAPSAHNRQPWRWIVLRDIEDKRNLAEAMGRDLVRTRINDGDDPKAIQHDYERSIERITSAPVVIIATPRPVSEVEAETRGRPMLCDIEFKKIRAFAGFIIEIHVPVA